MDLKEILSDVSGCFNNTTATYFDGYEDRRASAYQVLSTMMRRKYGLTHQDVSDLVDLVEQQCAEYIAEKSPGKAEE